MAVAPPVAAEPPLPGLDVAPPLPGTCTATPEPTAVVPPEPLAPGLGLSLPEQAAAMTMVSATIGARDASETEPARGDRDTADVLQPARLREVGGIALDDERCDGSMV
jgi:hypothetical protein